MRPELLEDWRTVGQLALLCQCGKAVELKRLGCCRSCYDRRLVQLWTELHAGAPLQFQLALGTASETRGQEETRRTGRYRELEPSQPNLALGKKPSEQLFGSSKPLVRQDDRLGIADGV